MTITTPTINPFDSSLRPVFVAAWGIKGSEDYTRPAYFCAVDIHTGAFFNARVLWRDMAIKHTGVVEMEMNMTGVKNILVHGDGSSVSVRGSAAQIRSYFKRWIGKVDSAHIWTFDLWDAGRYLPYCMGVKYDVFDLSTLFFMHGVDYYNAKVFARRRVSKAQNSSQPGYYAMVGIKMIERFKQLIKEKENEEIFPGRRPGAK